MGLPRISHLSCSIVQGMISIVEGICIVDPHEGRQYQTVGHDDQHHQETVHPLPTRPGGGQTDQ